MLHDMSDIAKEVAEDGGKKRKGSEVTLVVQRRMNHLKSNTFNGRSRRRRTEDLLHSWLTKEIGSRSFKLLITVVSLA